MKLELTQNDLPQAISTLLFEVQELKAIIANQSTPSNTAPDFLNIEQAGELLGLAKQTMYILVSKGKIPHMKKGKKLYFSRAEIEQYIRSGKRVTSGEADVFVNNFLTSKAK
jgi:excisionase family DNA binding protein